LVTSFDTDRRWDAGREFFPGAYRDEWLLRRHYGAIPPVEENWSGYGAIPFDIEEMSMLRWIDAR
jgi:hypothetical protein